MTTTRTPRKRTTVTELRAEIATLTAIAGHRNDYVEALIRDNDRLAEMHYGARVDIRIAAEALKAGAETPEAVRALRALRSAYRTLKHVDD